MIVLVLGVALWWAAHLYKRLAPASRAQLGDRGKGLVAAALAVSVVLMVLGYRAAPYIGVWTPPAFLIHVNNLLMLLAFYCYAASGMKTWLATRLRHPQLTAFRLWAVAHLLVNGDLASILLFGGLLVWAFVTVAAINRAEPAWTPPPPAPARKEVMAAVGAVVVLGIVAAIHTWLGVSPFGGA